MPSLFVCGTKNTFRNRALYKKGDRSTINNFRGISPLSHVGKSPLNIITNHLIASCGANDIYLCSSAGSDLGWSAGCMLVVK